MLCVCILDSSSLFFFFFVCHFYYYYHPRLSLLLSNSTSSLSSGDAVCYSLDLVGENKYSKIIFKEDPNVFVLYLVGRAKSEVRESRKEGREISIIICISRLK